MVDRFIHFYGAKVKPAQRLFVTGAPLTPALYVTLMRDGSLVALKPGM